MRAKFRRPRAQPHVAKEPPQCEIAILHYRANDRAVVLGKKETCCVSDEVREHVREKVTTREIKPAKRHAADGDRHQLRGTPTTQVCCSERNYRDHKCYSLAPGKPKYALNRKTAIDDLLGNGRADHNQQAHPPRQCEYLLAQLGSVREPEQGKNHEELDHHDGANERSCPASQTQRSLVRPSEPDGCKRLSLNQKHPDSNK